MSWDFLQQQEAASDWNVLTASPEGFHTEQPVNFASSSLPTHPIKSWSLLHIWRAQLVHSTESKRKAFPNTNPPFGMSCSSRQCGWDSWALTAEHEGRQLLLLWLPTPSNRAGIVIATTPHSWHNQIKMATCLTQNRQQKSSSKCSHKQPVHAANQKVVTILCCQHLLALRWAEEEEFSLNIRDSWGCVLPGARDRLQHRIQGLFCFYFEHFKATACKDFNTEWSDSFSSKRIPVNWSSYCWSFGQYFPISQWPKLPLLRPWQNQGLFLKTQKGECFSITTGSSQLTPGQLAAPSGKFFLCNYH